MKSEKRKLERSNTSEKKAKLLFTSLNYEKSVVALDKLKLCLDYGAKRSKNIVIGFNSNMHHLEKFSLERNTCGYIYEAIFINYLTPSAVINAVHESCQTLKIPYFILAKSEVVKDSKTNEPVSNSTPKKLATFGLSALSNPGSNVQFKQKGNKELDYSRLSALRVEKLNIIGVLRRLDTVTHEQDSNTQLSSSLDGLNEFVLELKALTDSAK